MYIDWDELELAFRIQRRRRASCRTRPEGGWDPHVVRFVLGLRGGRCGDGAHRLRARPLRRHRAARLLRAVAMDGRPPPSPPCAACSAHC